MRLVISSFGSIGDYEPFLALAKELKEHGHQPLLALPPQMETRVDALGLPFFPIGPTNTFEPMREMLAKAVSHGGATSENMQTYFGEVTMAKTFADLRAICSDAELLISSAEWPLGRVIHELTQLPYVSVHLTYFNEIYAEGGADVVRTTEMQLASYVNPFRRQLGLPSLYNPLTTDGISEQLALFASSQLLLDPAKESYWPDHYHVTGFFFLEGDEEWKPDVRLVDFLESGSPPVVFTFGSMIHEAKKDLYHIMLESVNRIGCRAIFITGWDTPPTSLNLPEHVYMTSFLPYHWLFPQVSCVVQSGGAGTVAWALRAGVPILCIPHVYEQFSLARFVKLSGCGLSIPFQMLSVDQLVTAVTSILADLKFRHNAQAASLVLQKEPGVRIARQLIEQWYDDKLK